MAEEKILTKHPLGKSGKNISKRKYETLKKAILSALKKRQLTHAELFRELNKSLRNKFSGNISWYGETVKLDLEARKTIERTSSKPEKYQVKSNAIIMKTEGTQLRRHSNCAALSQLEEDQRQIAARKSRVSVERSDYHRLRRERMDL